MLANGTLHNGEGKEGRNVQDECPLGNAANPLLRTSISFCVQISHETISWPSGT